MKYKELIKSGGSDYRVDRKMTKFKRVQVGNRRSVDVVNEKTGEVVPGEMTVTRLVAVDGTPFVKLYRPQVLCSLGNGPRRMLLWMVENMNRSNIVELLPYDEETMKSIGLRNVVNVYAMIKELREWSLVEKIRATNGLYRVSLEFAGKMDYKAISEDEDKERRSMYKKRDARRFVKVYDVMGVRSLSVKGMRMFVFCCLMMDYEGVVRFRYRDYFDMFGYEKGYGETHGRQDAYSGWREMMDRDMIRDVTAVLLEDKDRRRQVGRVKYFRVNPNVFIRGDRDKIYG